MLKLLYAALLGLAAAVLWTASADAGLKNTASIPELNALGYTQCLLFNEGRTDVEKIASNLQSNEAANFEMKAVGDRVIRMSYVMSESAPWPGEFVLFLMVWEQNTNLGVGCVGDPEKADEVYKHTQELLDFMISRMGKGA